MWSVRGRPAKKADPCGPASHRAREPCTWAFWLKFAPERVEYGFVHFERLAIEASDTTFTLDFHERLTVIAGVGKHERDGLMNELVGALSNGRSGVHLEVASDAGTRYALFRPVGAAHRVVDIDHAEDVTEAFTDSTRRVNILRRAGLSDDHARRAMRVSAPDLATEGARERFVLALARIDPARLWDVAQKVTEREERLNDAAEAVGSTPDEAEQCHLVEARHGEFEAAQAEVERIRQLTFLVAIAATVLAFPGAVVLGPWVAVLLIAVAVGMGVYSASFLQKLRVARAREEAALASVGANSYLNFQINRVNGLLANDHNRRELMQAAEDHRAALIEWQVLAGDVPIEWALDHRPAITAERSKLRRTLGLNTAMSTTLPQVDETFADLSDALTERLATTKVLGAGGESFPTFLDDPLIDTDNTTKAELLEFLVSASARQQIIYLTNDEDVASWARVEAMTGLVSIIEPGKGAVDETGRTGGNEGHRRSRHVAA